MKVMLSTLVALSFIAALAAPSHATFGNAKGKKTIERLDKEGRASHMT